MQIRGKHQCYRSSGGVQRGLKGLSLFVLACLELSLASSVGLAQRNYQRKSPGGIYLPSDRRDSRGIQRSRELISSGEFSQAIRFLDEILGRDEDSFVAFPDGTFLGLKEHARQQIRDLPAEGLEIYETTFGPIAKRLLRQAVESGDLHALRQVAQRYFYTSAGHEAALLFAQHEADQGRHLTAALTYQQLLDTPTAVERFQPQLSLMAATSWLAAKDPAPAAAVLTKLSQQAYRTIEVAGEDVPLFSSPSVSIDWLADSIGIPRSSESVVESQWLTARGASSRNGRSEGGLPHLRVRWQVRLLEDRNLEEVHDEMAGILSRRQNPVLPTASPLAVGDYVIARSAHGLVAIDFRTGKRVWRTQPQQVALLQELMDVGKTPSEKNQDVGPAQNFARMIWEDYLYNSTSSDGKRVYLIRDLASPRFDMARSLPFRQPNSVQHPNNDTNRLCAYDLPTEGKLIWEIDGAARDDELKGAFFLGAPVVVGPSLYCLAEIKSETAIYLVAIERETGQLLWRQQLADLEVGISRDIHRRLQAAMPSYDQGILVCPTSACVVIGVNLAKQSLAWAYRYEPIGRLTARQRMLEGHTLLTKKQWVYSNPVIADGRVLLTPPESDELHCLDLLTGKMIWKRPRAKSLFLAGVHDGKVLLIGNRQMVALQLLDGAVAWPQQSLDFPDGSTPTGSGFFSKGQYFLPLSNSAVIAVDVPTGKMVAKATSRDGQPLGNLICYRGTVVSQTGRHLDCFEQVDVLRADSQRRLAEDESDFDALRTLGEIAYNDGRLALAVELLSKAYQSEPEDLRTLEVLNEALVSALDEDFSAYQHLVPLLEQIQPTTVEAQLTLIRLQTKGLLEQGRPVEAYEICLQAYSKYAGARAQLATDAEYEVDSSSWLAAQIASAWSAASQDQQSEMLQKLQLLLEKTMASGDLTLRQEFYRIFGSLDPAQPIGLLLAQDYLDRQEPLRAQQLLLKLNESEEPDIRRAALAINSRILHEFQRPFLAASFDQRLEGDLADKECLPGLTGLQCLERWKTSDNSHLASWPYGRVDVKVQEAKLAGSAMVRTPNTGIRLERCDDVLGEANVTLLGLSSGRDRSILIRDSVGREFFRAKLDQSTQVMNVQGGVYGVSRGNLLIVSVGQQIVAFNTLAENPQPLWRKSITSNLQYLDQRRSGLQSNLGRHRYGRMQRRGQWLGLIGPVTDDSCVFQVDERLVCVDSLTGELRWSRSDLPLGCDLLGDDEYVFVVPPDSEHALIYSTVDGRSLGETSARIPAPNDRLTTVGREIICWRKGVDRRLELSAFDPRDGQAVWAHHFERNSQVDIAQNRFAVVVEPKGKCSIFDLRDGRLIVDQVVPPDLTMQKVYLLAGTKSFVVAVQTEHEVDRTRTVRGFNRSDFPALQVFSGKIFHFDRATGAALWDSPAEVEGLPFMLAQPVDLPTIAFAGNVTRRDKRGPRPEVGILLLEKASGRLLFHQENLPQSPHHFVMRTSDHDPHETIIEMSSRKVTLSFTGQPRAPEPPALDDVQRKAGGSSGGLQKIGEKLFRGG